jgi:hypothetical protein
MGVSSGFDSFTLSAKCEGARYLVFIGVICNFDRVHLMSINSRYEKVRVTQSSPAERSGIRWSVELDLHVKAKYFTEVRNLTPFHPLRLTMNYALPPYRIYPANSFKITCSVVLWNLRRNVRTAVGRA